MSPLEYLCHCNSRPRVSDGLWKEWYTTEHLPDLISSGCATRASFYEEVSTPFNTNPSHSSKFLALYQTEHPDIMKSENVKQVRLTSDLFLKESETTSEYDNGEFDIRNYILIQEHDPMRVGETSSPHILTVEMHPSDIEDFEKWYREEHVFLLQKLPGYRRSLRYRLNPKTVQATDETGPEYLAIHEIDDLSGFGGPEAEAANTTPWTKKHLDESKVVTARGWKLISAQGFVSA